MRSPLTSNEVKSVWTKKFIKKVQDQPERVKKIILWSVMAVLGMALLVLWILNVKSHFRNFNKEKFFEDAGVSNLKENLKSVPSFPPAPSSFPLESIKAELEKLDNLKDQEQ